MIFSYNSFTIVNIDSHLSDFVFHSCVYAKLSSVYKMFDYFKASAQGTIHGLVKGWTLFSTPPLDRGDKPFVLITSIFL